MTTDTHFVQRERVSAPRPMVAWHNVAILAAAVDAIGIFVVGILSGIAYNLTAYGDTIRHGSDFNFSLAVAVFYVIVRTVRGDYVYSAYSADSFPIGRIASAWLLAFMALLAAVFLIKLGNAFSRGTAFTLFVVGPLFLVVQQMLMSRWFVAASRNGRLAARRVFVVGEYADIDEHCQNSDVGVTGRAIVDTFALGDGSDPQLEATRLAAAVARARQCGADDVLVVLPLSQQARIRNVVDAFKVVPASLQLGADLLLKRYPALRTLRNGDSASLELVREPLTVVEQGAKRLFDIAVSGTALLLLSPLFLLIATSIKLSSPGPVFFRQNRHCYNRKTFRIFKFRTMRQDSEAGGFRQATRNDPRVTGFGAWLRRTSLDELPQLLNVFLGDMSIVGPRPHAIAHDHDFEKRIAYYARRHNIKPGITGWAQVNGYRGETNTDEKMRARVEYDLDYLDHWSLLLDIEIMLLTIISSKARSNAH